MTTWIVRESGRFSDMSAKVTLIQDGNTLGDMLYTEAQNFVMRYGGRNDTYIEEYEGGLPPVTLTVQHLFDSEEKWLQTLAELDAFHAQQQGEQQ